MSPAGRETFRVVTVYSAWWNTTLTGLPSAGEEIVKRPGPGGNWVGPVGDWAGLGLVLGLRRSLWFPQLLRIRVVGAVYQGCGRITALKWVKHKDPLHLELKKKSFTTSVFLSKYVW
jgi:hypothetical protein